MLRLTHFTAWGTALAALTLTCDVAWAVPDDPRFVTSTSPALAIAAWTVVQAVPDPLLVIGASGSVGGGVRWEVVPLVYSFGVAARPWRSLLIEPVARHSGAIEVFGSPEWACCAPGEQSSWILRAGGRVYFPLLGHGEALSLSLGASYYHQNGAGGVAGEVGVQTLFSILGLSVTVAPTLEDREVIVALTLRYF